ncbi:neuropeptide Y receptor type 5-like [Gigantopelta aegis]|uniref:neuropeptide Y receptor type 5-like n=1 Tax=Gigantopelta aegis TaxID=1735272 RepID=UPI001B88900A|nr:neuropeptide Y receptor type 5-like [Gigantopelta aegis]
MENWTSVLEALDLDAYDLPNNFSMDDLLKAAVQYDDAGHWFDSSAELFLILSFSIVIVFGITGNIAVVAVICRNGNLKSSRNLYILNLSVSEILACIFCMPFLLIRMTLKNWSLGTVLCKMVPTLQATYVFVSTLTIVSISMNRYKSIVCSITNNQHKHRTNIIIPMIWIISLIMSVPACLTHQIEHVPGVSGNIMYSICIEHWSNDTLLRIYTVTLLVIQYISPALAIVVLHVLICRFLGTRIDSQQTSFHEVNRAKRNMVRHKKNMLLLTSIAALFMITWLPLTLINILADMDQGIFQGTDFRLLHSVGVLIALCSVCINPVVYGWFNTNFRRELSTWKIFKPFKPLASCKIFKYDAREDPMQESKYDTDYASMCRTTRVTQM